jgi:large subunit ribosomal protein L4
MLLGALRSALTAKLRDGELKIVQAFTFGDHKTKTVVNALGKLAAPKKVLLVDNDAENRNLKLGARNIEGVTLLPSREVNPYHLLGHKHVYLSEEAAKRLSEGLL